MDGPIQIVGLGEVLMDIFEDGTATLGGAPLNVAVHAHQLLKSLDLGEGIVVSCIGKDEWGRHVQSDLKKYAMRLDYIAVADKPTGTSLVFENQDEIKFEICKDAAWDALATSAAMKTLAQRCTAVTFGSLAQRCATSRSAIQEFVSEVDGIRLYDVNLRRNTTDGEAGYSRSIIEASCLLANYIKMNISELVEIGEMFGYNNTRLLGEECIFPVMERLRREFSLKGVIVTRSRHGALFCDATEQITMPPCETLIKEVHPLGAGDAFSAGILFGLSRRWPISTCLQLAEGMGTWIAQHVSATPPLSAEIIAFAQHQLPLERIEWGVKGTLETSAHGSSEHR